jgi:hypothetical protein
MEWTIPIQKLQLEYINIGHQWTQTTRREYMQKPMAPLSYFGPQFRLPSLSILFPPLRVIEHSSATGKVVLDMNDFSLPSIKLSAFQDTLINSIIYHQSAWFNTKYTKDDIKSGFIPIFQDNKLILYCPVQQVPKGNIRVYKNGSWNNIAHDDLQPGAKVRISVKIHGISFLNKSPTDMEWSGKCRLQHRITGILIQKG